MRPETAGTPVQRTGAFQPPGQQGAPRLLVVHRYVSYMKSFIIQNGIRTI